MRFLCKTKIEKAWLAACVCIFIAHRLMDASSPDYYTAASPLRLWLELLMIVLSFPLGGLTLFALHSIAFMCDDCRSLEFLFDWSTLIFAGYIQWFWVLPEFLRDRELTLLDLKRLPDALSPHASPAVKEATPGSPAAATPGSRAASKRATIDAAPTRVFDDAPRHAFDAAAFAPRLAEFDETGRTALGRVFQAEPLPPPSQVETIFPRVS
ncbi:MAG TPA: hypothetical protein VEZ40_07185 [Pyrinomonadaceae bacterium]|nr:hypothetical protein [Pyrinomonadaceae bacterium]